MRNLRAFLLLSLIAMNSCVIPFSPNGNNDSYVLKENFVENNIGWIEEKTDFHELEIKNGYYFIHSKDTSFAQTSTSPLDKSFLCGLKNFEIETSFQLVKKSSKETQFGVFLVSGALEHDFTLDLNGEVFVKEFNYGNGKESTFLHKEISDFNFNSKHQLKILINEYNFSFYIDDLFIGKGILNACSWQDMRLRISSGTDLMVNSFTILRK